MTVKLAPNTLGRPRVTAVASAKVSKLAVQRNKLKRRCRSILKQLLPTTWGVDILVALRVGSKDSDYMDLFNDIRNCLNKTRINVVK